MNRASLGLLIVFGFCIASRASERPNILFIAVDDLRPSIGCYGDTHAKTPNLDGLAERGLLFNHAYSQNELPVLADQRITPNTPKYALANNSELSHYVDLIDFPQPWDEETLAPIFDDLHSPVHTGAINQYYRKLDGRESMGYSIRSTQYRLVEWRDFATGDVVCRELYDHAHDHSETTNIIESADAELVSRLTAELLQTHPRQSLSLTPAVHSNPNKGRWQADITFENATQAVVSIYAITTEGRRGKASKLKPAEAVTIHARIGGVYVVESSDGKIHEIHSPSMPARRVIVSEN